MRLLCWLFLLLFAPSFASAQEGWIYLDNGQARLGVNLEAGATIGWFSPSGSEQNLLNTYDVGRYVQQSWYGNPDGSDWNGKPWRYNPVQGGSWRNQPAKVQETRQHAGHLYNLITPRHWATGELLPEMIFEQWLRLEGKCAHLKFKVTWKGKDEQRPTHQELPALFVHPQLDTLVLPDVQGAWQRHQPGFPNEYFHRGSAPWAAWVDDQDQGVGFSLSHAEELTAYRVRNGNRGDCSYAAPIATMALKPGMVYEYEVVLTFGSLAEIRAALEDKGRSR